MGAGKKFLAIAGNIGVGKSTLTGMLAGKMGWEPFYEAVDDNPYLADFYKDMRTWSFHSQIFFLTRRLRHHRQLLDHPGSVVQDRSVYEDAEIFARNLYEQGNMTDRDYDSYHELYRVLTEFLPPPDVVVYLRASVDTLLERIRKRGRDGGHLDLIIAKINEKLSGKDEVVFLKEEIVRASNGAL
jgi:deoxyadenosine/deoxycytidine kinase